MPAEFVFRKSSELKPFNLSASYAAGAEESFFLGVISASVFMVMPRYNGWLKLRDAVDDASPIDTEKIPLVVVAVNVSSNIEEPPVDAVYNLALRVYVPSATAAPALFVSLPW